MCREIIEAHHGRIRVDSTVGKGTSFTLKFPTANKANATRPVDRCAVPAAPIFPTLAVPVDPTVAPLPFGD
jgi:hypothetical protein